MSFLASLVKPVAYLSLPALLLRTWAHNSPRGKYYVRSGLYVCAFSLVGIWAIGVAAAMSLIGDRYNVNYIVARSFYAVASWLLDIRVEVEGEEHLATKPSVLMANHQSMMDILILSKMFPKRTTITAKQSLRFSPVGPFMSMSGAVFIDRGNNARAVRSLEAAGEVIKRDQISIWMYPEGTRRMSEQPDMLPPKKGGFHLAVQAGIPIIPIVTENYWRLYRKDVFETGVIKMRVLPPIPTTGLASADVPALAVRVRDQMLETLREISAQVHPGSGPEAKKTPDSVQIPPQPVNPESPPLVVPLTNVREDTPTAWESSDPHLEGKQGSGDSLSASTSSLESSTQRHARYEPSENGTETEEDEGMVLVGRPS